MTELAQAGPVIIDPGVQVIEADEDIDEIDNGVDDPASFDFQAPEADPNEAPDDEPLNELEGLDPYADRIDVVQETGSEDEADEADEDDADDEQEGAVA